MDSLERRIVETLKEVERKAPSVSSVKRGTVINKARWRQRWLRLAATVLIPLSAVAVFWVVRVSDHSFSENEHQPTTEGRDRTGHERSIEERVPVHFTSEMITEPRRSCIAQADEEEAPSCGLTPPARRTNDGIGHHVTTVTGESFWILLPEEVVDPNGAVAFPGVLLEPAFVRTPTAWLSMTEERAFATQFCTPQCSLAADEFPGGAREVDLRYWRDDRGAVPIELATLSAGEWMVALWPIDEASSQRIAEALTYRVTKEGYLLLETIDDEVRIPDSWSDVTLSAQLADGTRFSLQVSLGCRSSRSNHDASATQIDGVLKMDQDGGNWCYEKQYALDVEFSDRSTHEDLLEQLHDSVRIEPVLE